jgi:hypothetical protein
MLRICVLGLGGGGFQYEAQSIIGSLNLPPELILIYSGPKGGLIFWNVKGIIRKSYIIESPALSLNSAFRRLHNFVINIFYAIRIIIVDKPSIIMAVGTGQAIPFGIVAKLLKKELWFIESITRVNSASRTGRWMHRLRLASRIYYYWDALRSQYVHGIYIGEH